MLSGLVVFALALNPGPESIHTEDANPLGKRAIIERVGHEHRTGMKPPFAPAMRVVPVRASSPDRNSVIAAAEARGSEVTTLFTK